MSARSLPWLLIAAFFALYCIWGSTYLVILIGVQSWPPLMLAGLRFSIAGLLFYAWLRWRGAPAPSGRQWLASSALGFLLLVCGNGGVTLAEHGGVASGVAALAVATMPLFALAFGLLWGQRPQRLELAGIGLGLLGIVLLNLGSNLQGNTTGALLLLLASAAWAFGSVWSRYLPVPSGLMSSAAQMVSAGVVLMLASVLSGEQLETLPGWQGWGALFYLVVFGSIIAFSAYLYLLQTVRPAAATSYCYVNPVVAVLLGIAFAGEQIAAAEWWAMLVILAGVILIGLPQWRRGH